MTAEVAFAIDLPCELQQMKGVIKDEIIKIIAPDVVRYLKQPADGPWTQQVAPPRAVYSSD